MVKADNHIFQGLTLDADPLKHKSEFLVDARNIRFTSRGEDTEMAITNEKGTTLANFIPRNDKQDSYIKGSYVGHTSIGKYVVVFTHDTDADHIYRIEVTETDPVEYIIDDLLTAIENPNERSLGFDPNHPIECLTYYESELLQKVYWTDGLNQPRVINIVKDKLVASEVDSTKMHYFNNTIFDFVPELELKENIKITKEYNATGNFPAGTLQYAITYYNKYGQETNIAWVSPLLYTSFDNRAGSPEESIGNVFNLTFNKVDSNYDYMRVYSIMHTAKDGTPIVKIVSDININSFRELYSYSRGYPITKLKVHPSNILLVKKDGVIDRFVDVARVLSIDDIVTNKTGWPIIQDTTYYQVSLSNYDKIIESGISYTFGEAKYLYAPTTLVQVDDRADEQSTNDIKHYGWCMFVRDGKLNLSNIETSSTEHVIKCLGNFRVSFTGDVGFANATPVSTLESPYLSKEFPTDCNTISQIGDYTILTFDKTDKSLSTLQNTYIYYVDNDNYWRVICLSELIKTFTEGTLKVYMSSVGEYTQGDRLPKYLLAVKNGTFPTYIRSYSAIENSTTAKVRGNKFVIASSSEEFESIRITTSEVANVIKGETIINRSDRSEIIGRIYNDVSIDHDYNNDSYNLKQLSITNSKVFISTKPFIWDTEGAKKYNEIISSYNTDTLITGEIGVLGIDLEGLKIKSCLKSTNKGGHAIDSTDNTHIDQNNVTRFITKTGNTFVSDLNDRDAVAGSSIYYHIYLNGAPEPTSDYYSKIESNPNGFYTYNSESKEITKVDNNTIRTLRDKSDYSKLYDKDFNSNILGLSYFNFYKSKEDESLNWAIIDKNTYPNVVVRTFFYESDTQKWSHYDVTFNSDALGTDAMLFELEGDLFDFHPLGDNQEEALQEALGSDYDINDYLPRYYVVSLDPFTLGSGRDKGEIAYTDEKIHNLDTRLPIVKLPLIKYSGTEINSLPTEITALRLLKSVNSNIVLTDNNLHGETIDPTALLYVGGESIKAETLTVKDGTLFLGNINIIRPSIEEDVKKLIKDSYDKITQEDRTIMVPYSGLGNFYNTLSAVNTSQDNIENPKTFKTKEWYRLGVQFQYKTGKWSDPIFLQDYQIAPKDTTSSKNAPFINLENVRQHKKGNLTQEKLIQLVTNLNLSKSEIKSKLKGYKKIRPVVVIPSEFERTVLCQGVANPTVYSLYNRINDIPYVQASWFFRPAVQNVFKYVTGKNDYTKGSYVQYEHNRPLFVDSYRGAEIQGIDPFLYSHFNVTSNVTSFLKNPTDWSFKVSDIEGTINYPNTEIFKTIRKEDLTSIFCVDSQYITLNTPDIEYLGILDGCTVSHIGDIRFMNPNSHGHLSLQLASTGISTDSHIGVTDNNETFTNHCRGMYASLSYYDGWVDDSGDDDGRYWVTGYSEGLWMVYPWQKSDSINNDTKTREGATSVLKKKVLTNIRYSDTIRFKPASKVKTYPSSTIGIFRQEDESLVKVSGHNYYGSIDTSIIPPFHKCNIGGAKEGVDISISEPYGKRTWNLSADYFMERARKWDTNYNTECFVEASRNRRVYYMNNNYGFSYTTAYLGDNNALLTTNQTPIRMKYKSTSHLIIDLGTPMTYDSLSDGYARFNLMEITKTPTTLFGGTTEEALQKNEWLIAGEAVDIESEGTTTVKWKWGDTFYQVWDCLKTYPYTADDENQIIDVLSFAVESRINCDGRYDRNRGLTNIDNISPKNFNLRNTAYDQTDNFFKYRILPADFYKLSSYPITYAWGLQKQVASDVDTWTTVTMANQLDLDGNYGPIRALRVYNDKLIAFQEDGISYIQFNNRVQINTSDGVPIEISNNYKVQGSVYLSTNLGCKNKWSIITTTEGLYFIDTKSQELYQMGSKGMNNISKQLLCSSWFKSLSSDIWHTDSADGIRLFYDNQHADIYITNGNKESLVFSERINRFTSFMSYDNLVGVLNIDKQTFAISKEYSDKPIRLWKMFDGKYNSLFDVDYTSYGVSYISNPEATTDKIFSTINVRADWFKDNTLTPENEFFDTIQVLNEYQDTGVVSLNNRFVRITDSDYKQKSNPSNLRKKFRVWRINIPRDKSHKRDRIRNLWSKVTFKHDSNTNSRMELHDLTTLYFI